MCRLIWDDLHGRIAEQTRRGTGLTCPPPLPRFSASWAFVSVQHCSSFLGIPPKKYRKPETHKPQRGRAEETHLQHAGRRKKADHQEIDAATDATSKKSNRANLPLKNVCPAGSLEKAFMQKNATVLEDIPVLVGRPTGSMQTSFRGG